MRVKNRAFIITQSLIIIGMALLEMDNLTIEYETDQGVLTAVDDFNLDVKSGETVGIVGESGCGKTTATKPILGILDDNGRVVDGEIRYRDEVLTDMTEKELRERIRWQEISYIPQNAMAALDPVFTVGSQVIEVIREHTDSSKADARSRTADLFEAVELDSNRMNEYPHELSGGQRQRVTIALALALEPALIIADEPTTGLDVVVQDEILELIGTIQDDIGCSMIFITHDMSAIAEIADRVAVTYAGRVVEVGSAHDVFKESAHPYTIGLQNAFPKMERNPTEASLITIPGSPPDLHDPPSGCRFAERCPFATAECDRDPPRTEVKPDHVIECHFPGEADSFRRRGSNSETWRRDDTVEAHTARSATERHQQG